MPCNLCNATVKPETLDVATIFHFWMLLCDRCAEQYGERDEQGRLTYKAKKAEPKHVQ